MSCISITTIPKDLFKNNTKVTSFDSTFKYCRSLTSIPAGLFDNFPEVTDFDSTFNDCGSIISKIPNVWDTHSSKVTSSVDYGKNTWNSINYMDIPQNFGGPTVFANLIYNPGEFAQVDGETEIRLAQNMKLKEPKLNINEGYELDGWYTEPEFMTKIDFATKRIGSSNITIYAKIIPIA